MSACHPETSNPGSAPEILDTSLLANEVVDSRKKMGVNKDINVWNLVIQRVEKRLACLQKGYLSKGWEEVLIKSTLSSIPTHCKSLFNAPNVIGKLERLQRNFLWDATNGAKKFNLVRWETVTSPKLCGGLGVKDLMVFNKALLGKDFSVVLKYAETSLEDHVRQLGYDSSNQGIPMGGKFVPIHPDEEKLKELAKRGGLWNLWIPFDSAARAGELIFGRRNGLVSNDSDSLLGADLANLEYGYLCEIMGHSVWAPQIFNCGAPDTGNMEVLFRYGNEVQMKEWLVPLLEGKICSGFAMTDPQVESSDATTNMECSIKREPYFINGSIDPEVREIENWDRSIVQDAERESREF
ncbi:hypothetical protein CQW23_01708 [Capsicum baccatum]|uniref:Uncharacterized protein n=1 Tax=Capsicum baccatum TaxID=33114 RepID=A0A2G2XPC6_CAPBA|nr:hypothetical protein CQW23_01708 [Capsicum baccatum]